MIIEEQTNKTIEEQNPQIYKEIFKENLYQTTPEELKDATVIDIGANIGCFSIFASTNKARKIYAIEPNLENFKQLLINCLSHDTITPINLAISKPGLKQAHLSSNGVGCKVVEEDQGDFVNCISLEELLDIIPDKNLVLKMDCEGSEYDIIFPSPPHIIKRFKYIYAEIHNNMHPNPTYNYNMFEKFMNDLDFVSSVTQAATGMWWTDGTFTAGSWEHDGTFVPCRRDWDWDTQYYRLIKFINKNQETP